jgi:hypothetical protein
MSYRNLIIKNKITGAIVHTRRDCTSNCGISRITKPLYDLLMDGNHIAFYENAPDKIRIPVMDPISGRYYVKPHDWDGVLRKGQRGEVYFV